MECHTQFEEQLHMFLANTNVALMFNQDSTFRDVINRLIARMLEINGFRNLRSNYTILNHYDYSETPVINRHVPVDIAFIECDYLRFRSGVKIWLNLGENPRFRAARHVGRRRVLFEPQLFHLHRDITRQMYKHNWLAI